MDAKTLQRFLDKYIVDSDGCWIWQAGIETGDYGTFWDPRRKTMTRTHRASYEHFVGPIPDGMQIDHLCRNRRCVNPKHLEPVTQQENIRRGNQGKFNAAKTHCKRGHEYNDANTYRNNGERVCRTCQREHARKHRAAKSVLG